MQPWKHAQISAKRDGRDWRDDLAIHEFMDIAKSACPDLRHRLVLHNSDLGPHLAARAFPDRPHAREVALAHVRQDLGCTPSLADWLSQCPVASLPRIIDVDALIASAAAKQNMADDAPVREVWDVLQAPGQFASSEANTAPAILMNAVALPLVRAIFGPARAVSARRGGDTVFDPSWTAEGMIVAQYGRIAPLTEVLANYKSAPVRGSC